jgi:flagella basal body P-ring formation protein FlgA
MLSKLTYRWEVATLIGTIVASVAAPAFVQARAISFADSLLEQRLTNIITQQLQTVYPAEQYKFELELKRIPRTVQGLAPEQVVKAEQTSRGAPRGYETFQLFLVDQQGKDMGQTHLQIHLRLWQKLPVPQKRILAGENLSSNQLTYKWVELTRMTGTFLTEISLVDGHIADHMLPPDRPLRETDLAKPSVVEAGDMVNMQFSDGALQISLRCVARQAAAKGEEIRVFSEQTRRTYQVKVVNNKQVQWVKTL